MTTTTCTCPSGDGSLRWPCPAHPPDTLATQLRGYAVAIQDEQPYWADKIKAACDELEAQAKPAEPSTERVEVDAAALRRVLVALNSQGHEIRELQVLRGSLWPDSPIDKLTGEFNAWVKAHDGFTKKDDTNG